MKMIVTVPGNVVGKNEARGLDFKRKRFFIPTKMRVWMRHVAVCAHDEAQRVGWPDPFLVREASYLVRRYNVAGDTDRGNTFLVDALQFTRWSTPRGTLSLPGPIGIVANDKDLWCAGSPPAIRDERGPRVEVELVLKALRSPAEADALRRRWYENEIRRAAKKAKQRTKKADVQASASVKRKRDEIARIEENLGIRLPLGNLS